MTEKKPRLQASCTFNADFIYTIDRHFALIHVILIETDIENAQKESTRDIPENSNVL